MLHKADICFVGVQILENEILNPLVTDRLLCSAVMAIQIASPKAVVETSTSTAQFCEMRPSSVNNLRKAKNEISADKFH